MSWWMAEKRPDIPSHSRQTQTTSTSFDCGSDANVCRRDDRPAWLMRRYRRIGNPTNTNVYKHPHPEETTELDTKWSLVPG